jgi:hypothetical protein
MLHRRLELIYLVARHAQGVREVVARRKVACLRKALHDRMEQKQLKKDRPVCLAALLHVLGSGRPLEAVSDLPL